jgi:hypothetical protein
MKPTVQEFQDDTKLKEEVKAQIHAGVKKENLYVISHDDDRSDRVAGSVGANEPDDLGELVGKKYSKKGDELRAVFQEFGFSTGEASELEEKLDHGKILLLIKQ